MEARSVGRILPTVVGRVLPASGVATKQRSNEATKRGELTRGSQRAATLLHLRPVGLLWILSAISLLLLGVAGRLLPHPPNFTPLAAIALFGGFFFRDLRWAVAVPLAALIVSDAFLGTYDLRVMAVVYAGLLCPVLLRGWLRQRLTAGRVLCSSGLISLVFFVSSNFAVWAFSGMYSPTLSGLVSCYVAALPFFKYTLAGNLMYGTALFGAYAAVRTLAARRLDVRAVPCLFS